MKDTERKNTVYELRLSPSSFEVVLEAIHALSAKTQRFETLASVIAAGTQFGPEAITMALSNLEAIGPLDGDIKVFARLTSERQKQFEQLRVQLNEEGARLLGVREAVIVCALLIAPRN